MIAEDEDGLVIFDGGSYSRGPSQLMDVLAATLSPDQDALQIDRDNLERQLELEVRLCTYAGWWHGESSTLLSSRVRALGWTFCGHKDLGYVLPTQSTHPGLL